MIGVWLWLFWPMMSGQSVAGFRDSAYLYYPMFQWIDLQMATGNFPLWDPNCNLGIPLLADGTSSLLYPGKIVFFLRFLSFPARYGIYLAIHFPLAAAGTFWLAKTLKSSTGGATFAALSYAMSGSFLFQVNNVVYLVSAAWLPVALCCVWRFAHSGKIAWAVGGGVCCAMMILGGDPQMTYHIGLIAFATSGFKLLGHWRASRRSHLKGRSLLHKCIKEGRGLIVLVTVTTLLALVQIWPTYQWSRHSERTHSTGVANVYQLINKLGKDEPSKQNPAAIRHTPNDDLDVMQSQIKKQLDQLVGPIAVGSHQEFSYQFSQPPWSLAELVWPNASGRLFPFYQRWTDALPGADRVWVPSLYAGFLTFWLAISGFRLWGRRKRHVWLTWLGLFFALGSFGWFGLIWMINEFRTPDRPIASFGPQVGGVYWGMVMLLPKYFAFRYPAKLFLIAGLSLSLLAGLQIHRRRFKFFQFDVLLFLGVSIVLLIVLSFVSMDQLDRSIAPDVLFGPFDSIGWMQNCRWSIIQSSAILIAEIALCFSASRLRWSPKVLTLGLIGITTLDCVVANRWMLAEVPATTFERKLTRNQVDRWRNRHEFDRPISVYRNRLDTPEPAAWSRTRSESRMEEIVMWQRETLFPKHHLTQDVRLIGSFSSIWPVKYEWLNRAMEADYFAQFHDGDVLCDYKLVAEEVDGIYVVRLEEFNRRLGPHEFPRDETDPDSFWICCIVSGLSWGMVVFGALFVFRSKRRRRPKA